MSYLDMYSILKSSTYFKCLEPSSVNNEKISFWPLTFYQDFIQKSAYIELSDVLDRGNRSETVDIVEVGFNMSVFRQNLRSVMKVQS